MTHKKNTGPRKVTLELPYELWLRWRKMLIERERYGTEVAAELIENEIERWEAEFEASKR